ncbi:MAG: hypothetical protein GWP04_00850 [Gammaproteobacteria bacterium]|nr:hypothetical protein [Gammaproteobacteria bacterium]
MSVDPGHDGSTRQVARNAALSVAGLVIIGLVRFVEQVGANALFGVEALAWVTVSISVATLATVIGPTGLSAGITKLISELRGSRPQDASSFAALSARIALGLTVLGAAGGFAYAFFDPSLSAGGIRLAVGVALLTLTFGVYQTGKSILYGEERIGRYVQAEMIGGGLFIAAALLVIFTDASWAVVLPLAVAYVPVGWFAATRLHDPIVERDRLPIRSLFGYGGVGSVGALSGVGFTRATPLVASFLAGVPGTALVGASLAVLEPLYLAPRAIGLALLPRLSFEKAAETTKSTRLVEAATGIVALVAGPFCALLILEQDRILQVVFSDRIVGGVTLAWFAAAFFVSVVGAPAVTSLAAIRVKDAAIPMWSSIVGFTTAGIIWAVFGTRFGTEAVAAGYFVGSVLQVLAPLIVASRRYEIRWGSLWARLAVAGAAVVGPAVLFPPAVWLDAVVLSLFVAMLAPELRTLTRILVRS